MYGVYSIEYWTRLALRSPKVIASWINIDGEPDFESDDLDTAINYMRNNYYDKLYTKQINGGTSCLLVYVIDSSHNIIATMDFDNTVNFI